MSQDESTSQEPATKNVKSSEEVIKEIAGGSGASEQPAPDAFSAKSLEEVSLRLRQLEVQRGAQSSVVVSSSERDEDEKRQLQLVKQQELRKLVAEADKMVQDNEGRRKFSWAIFSVTVAWMFMVLFIVIQCANERWHLSDSVLIALITTTTATVIGIFVIVANYLFNRDKST